MSEVSPIHLLPRADGQWQVERESALVPVSIHERYDQALTIACKLAQRDQVGLTIHRSARPRARDIDKDVRRLLLTEARAGTGRMRR